MQENTIRNKSVEGLLLPIKTDRLLIRPINIDDTEFILELLNTEGWLRFIGNRNIASSAGAKAYIKKKLDNENIYYWVVQPGEHKENMGLITYIKRDYLEHRDIGFAFLPRFANKGYAFEATNAVLKRLIYVVTPSHILATTIPENVRSINLLKKIGLCFEKEIEVDKERLHVYGMSPNKLRAKMH